MILIAHNIRSSFNVGSLFRTADAAGVAHIYLTGYSPAPLDRFKQINKSLIKVSLGAEKNIKWNKKAHLGQLLSRLKQQNYKIFALEQDPRAVNIKKVRLSKAAKEKTALLVGNEVRGLDQKILKKADRIIEIPMLGKKESLNVAVAAGIALYWLNVLG